MLKPNFAFSPPLSAQLPGALAQQPRADADERLDAELFGNGNDLPQFLQFFDDHDDRLAQLDAEHGHLDEFRVLVAVADDEAAQLVLQRQTGEQLRLAADFEAEIIRLARVENFLHHLAQLVHLDRKHAAILALVIVLRDGVAERLVQRLDAMAQNVLKPDEQRKFQPARLGLLDHVRQIHRHARVLQRARHDVPGVVDVEILRAPAVDVVKRARRVNVPRRACVG